MLLEEESLVDGTGRRGKVVLVLALGFGGGGRGLETAGGTTGMVLADCGAGRPPGSLGGAGAFDVGAATVGSLGGVGREVSGSET